MDKLKQIIKSKPRWVVLLIFSYILILGVLKWRLSPDISTVFYLLGGLFGVYFMDLADLVFDIKPSPFRSIVFIVLFGIVSFFIVTSSGSMFAAGLVLSLYFTLLLLQAEEWQEYQNLNAWFTLGMSRPSVKVQRWIVLGIALFLVLETLLFIR
ncbi:hypothetical protein MUP56_02605 [Patescibacteria group bacterium]|nr:hypothetical protein [Patescibacteria group bacterium]